MVVVVKLEEFGVCEPDVEKPISFQQRAWPQPVSNTYAQRGLVLWAAFGKHTPCEGILALPQFLSRKFLFYAEPQQPGGRFLLPSLPSLNNFLFEHVYSDLVSVQTHGLVFRSDSRRFLCP